MTIDERQMKIEINSLESILLSELKGKIFHVTTRIGYTQIIKEGYIRANVSNVPKWPTPKMSYGSTRNYVCLFNLIDVSDEEIQVALKYLNPDHCEEEPVYIFLAESIIPKLTPWTEAEREVGFSEQWVPYIEAWHPSPLSIECINYVLKLNIILDEAALRCKRLANALRQDEKSHFYT